MPKTAGPILKSSDVKFEGKFQLQVGSVRPLSPQGGPAAGEIPLQVKIVESHPEYALIEAICSCGTKTYIKCEYAGSQNLDSQPKQGEEISGENKNET